MHIQGICDIQPLFLTSTLPILHLVHCLSKVCIAFVITSLGKLHFSQEHLKTKHLCKYLHKGVELEWKWWIVWLKSKFVKSAFDRLCTVSSEWPWQGCLKGQGLGLGCWLLRQWQEFNTSIFSHFNLSLSWDNDKSTTLQSSVALIYLCPTYLKKNSVRESLGKV